MVEADRSGTPWAQRAWRWARKHRLRIADWLYAGAAYLVLAQTIPVGWGTPVGILPDSLTPQPTTFSLWPPVWEAFFFLLLVAPVLFRRSRPTWLLVTALATLVVLGSQVLGMLALYTYAVWFNRRWTLAAWSLAMVVGAAVSVSAVDPFWPIFTVWLVATIALPLTFGLWVGTRHQLIANLRERAARLERERDLEAKHAITAERTRIAREMHDVVAHRVSLMVLHAGGLEVSAADERTQQTAALIRGTGREALSELREILGVLRDDTSVDTAPHPGVAGIERLVDDWRSTGTTVDWRVRGTERPLSAQAERTLYRTVQEAMTNAGKHAPGAPVTVDIDYGDTEVRAVVTNGPPPSGGPPPADQPSGQYGLAGLRERVGLAGGALLAGPRPDGGWHVRATVPTAAAPSEAVSAGDDDGTGAGKP